MVRTTAKPRMTTKARQSKPEKAARPNPPPPNAVLAQPRMLDFFLTVLSTATGTVSFSSTTGAAEIAASFVETPERARRLYAVSRRMLPYHGPYATTAWARISDPGERLDYILLEHPEASRRGLRSCRSRFLVCRWEGRLLQPKPGPRPVPACPPKVAFQTFTSAARCRGCRQRREGRTSSHRQPVLTE